MAGPGAYLTLGLSTENPPSFDSAADEAEEIAQDAEDVAEESYKAAVSVSAWVGSRVSFSHFPLKCLRVSFERLCRSAKAVPRFQSPHECSLVLFCSLSPGLGQLGLSMAQLIYPSPGSQAFSLPCTPLRFCRRSPSSSGCRLQLHEEPTRPIDSDPSFHGQCL